MALARPTPRRSHDGSFSTGSTDALHRHGGIPGLFGNKPVLLFDHGARGSIAVEPAKDFAWNAAIGPLGSIFVEHIKQDEFFARCRLSCHSPSPIIASWGTSADRPKRANVQRGVGDLFLSSPQSLEIQNDDVYRLMPVEIGRASCRERV